MGILVPCVQEIQMWPFSLASVSSLFHSPKVWEIHYVNQDSSPGDKLHYILNATKYRTLTWNYLGIVFLGFSWVKKKSLICRIVPRKASVLLFCPAELSGRRGGGFQCGGAVPQPGQFFVCGTFSYHETRVRSKSYHVLSLALAVENLSHSEHSLKPWQETGGREDHGMFSFLCYWSCVFWARFGLLMQIAQHNLGWVWGGIFHTCW